ncbi:MAG: recombinase family protein [Eubacteriales bacterium]
MINFNRVGKGKWYANSVNRILSNPIYTGTLEQGKKGKVNYKAPRCTSREKDKWVILDDNHEAIIEKELFDTVQRVMSLDTRVAPNKQELYLFSGLLYCCECGEPLKRKIVPYKEKKYIYYSCQKCASKSIKEEKLIECVLLTLQKYIEERVTIAEVIEMVDVAKFCSIRVKRLSEQLKFYETEYDRVCNYKRYLYEEKVDGKVSSADYQKFYNQFTVDEEKWECKIREVKKEIEDILSKKDDSSIWLEQFKCNENLKELNRSILVRMIDKILLEDNHVINITFRFQDEYNNLVDMLNNMKELSGGMIHG